MNAVTAYLNFVNDHLRDERILKLIDAFETVLVTVSRNIIADAISVFLYDNPCAPIAFDEFDQCLQALRSNGLTVSFGNNSEKIGFISDLGHYRFVNHSR